MKALRLLSILICFLQNANAASFSTSNVSGDKRLATTTGKNYTIKRTPSVFVRQFSDLINISVEKQHAEITYYDGLGRVSQVVKSSSIPSNGKFYDYITFKVYDKIGIESKRYLEFPLSRNDENLSGAFVDDPVGEQRRFYGNQPAYSEIIYDKSPLNRIVEESSAGADWQLGSGHTMTISRGGNDKSIVKWAVDNENQLIISGYYDIGELIREETRGADSRTTVEYKNSEGKVVRRIQDYDIKQECVNATTDFVYDDFGRLCWVLPPKYVASLDANGRPKGLPSAATLIQTDTQLKTPSNGAYILTPSATLTLKPGFVGQVGFSVALGEALESLDELAYSYIYDGYGRMAEKKLPGIKPTYYVYDKGNRLCMSQDANDREKNCWRLLKYDDIGRLIQEATYTDQQKLSQPAMQAYYDQNSAALYANVSEDCINREQYYDNYGAWRNAVLTPKEEVGLINLSEITTNLNGMLVGERNRILNKQTGMSSMLSKVYYYDDKGRIIQVVEENHLRGISIFTSQLDWCGVTKASRERHTYAGGANTQFATKYYSYYDSGQLKSVSASLNGAPLVELARYSYDELGRMKVKELVGSAGANSALQKLEHHYNIKGWLTQINNPSDMVASGSFALRLGYNNIKSSGSRPLYDGNISEMEWVTPNAKEAFGYQLFYDGLGRVANSLMICNSINKAQYEERNIKYDLNGNIKSLDRTGSREFVDQLRYRYNGNKLIGLQELSTYSGPDDVYARGGAEDGGYEYDANGNMKMDKRKGISLIYNYLDLPYNVSGPNIGINYVYDATGRKLEANLRSGAEAYDYLGSFVLKGVNANATSLRTPESWLYEEGRATYASNSWIWEYHLKDHLGNTRVVLADNGNGTAHVAQTTDYYPFGAMHKGTSNLVGTNRWKYNGKESQEFANLALLDYGARFYDPELGLFHSYDLKSEESMSQSPFVYADNNPIKFIDFMGMNADWFQNEVTKDVYYNSQMGKGDEGTGDMKGKGWVYMGKNGMFSDGGAQGVGHDMYIISQNSNLGEVAAKYNEASKKVEATAMFKGGNAEKFMEKQGYTLMPKESYATEVSLTFQSPSGYWSTTVKKGEEVWTKVTYQPKNAVYKTYTTSIIGSAFDIKRDTYNKYEYLGTNKLLPYIEGANRVLELYNRSFTSEECKIYKEGWSSYPKNGYLNKYNK